MVANTADERLTQGTLRAADGELLPLEGTSIEVLVRGPVAVVNVEQRFRNTRSETIEAVYSFPLPAHASVEHMEFRLASRVVKGVVKGRAEAKRDYERARKQGKSATLLEQDQPSLFTLSVANVRPGETLTVVLRYQELLQFDDGQWRFVFPLVAPARYAPSPVGGSSPMQPTGTRTGDVSAKIEISGASEIQDLRCPTHPVEIEATETGHSVSLRATETLPNRDLVITWRAATAGVRPSVHFEPQSDGPGTLLLVLTPPQTAEKTPPETAGNMRPLQCGNCGGPVTNVASIQQIPGLGPVFPCGFCGAILTPSQEGRITKASRARDVLVLVDRSASMRGSTPIVRAAVQTLLRSLDPGDAVQVIAFDHDRNAFQGDGSTFVTLSPEVAGKIDTFLETLPPRGGTELERAIEAIAASKPREGSARPVLLITDATVGNEGRLLRRVGELLPNSAARRLFVLGIGERLDRSFIDRLARAGGGASDTLAPGEEMQPVLERICRRIRDGGPVLTGLSLSFEGTQPEDLYPSSLPDLYGGQPITVLGRAADLRQGKLVLTAATADGRPFRQELTLAAPPEPTPGLVRLWAKRRIDALLEQLEREPSARSRIEPLVAQLGIAHSLVTPYTSLVAEDSELPAEKPEHEPVKLDIPAAEPSGGEALTGGSARGGGGSGDVKKRALSKHESPADDDTLERERGLEDSEPDVPSVGTDEIALDVDSLSVHGYERDELSDSDAPSEPATGAVTGTWSRPMAKSSLAAPGRLEGAPAAPPAEASLAEASIAPPIDVRERHVDKPMSARTSPAPARMGAAMRSPVPHSVESTEESPASRGGGGGFFGALAGGIGRLFGATPSGATDETPEPPPAPEPAPTPRPEPSIAADPSPKPMFPPTPQHSPPAAGPALESADSEAYPTDELDFITQRTSGELDLVFLVDETGSMGSYIGQVKSRLTQLISVLSESPLCRNLRIGIVTYRDHPPQDNTYASRVVPFSSDMAALRQEVDHLQASGGGDGPESVTDGLFELVRLDWRPRAAKTVVWFGDAPPHGVVPDGDGFPQGCPCGNHWFTQAESCREMGIAVHAVGCVPGIRAFVGAEEVFRLVASTARGLYIPLTHVDLLVPVIVGAAYTELDKQRLDERLADLVGENKAALAATDIPEMIRWLTEQMGKRGVQPRSLAYDPDRNTPSPMRFRALSQADVAASLDRLRLAGRI